MKSFILKLGLFIAVLGVGSLRARALDGAVVIANSSVPADSLSADALKDIYTANTKYWDGGQSIIIAVMPDQTDAAIQQVSGMDANTFKTFWKRLMFSGRGKQPKSADDTASLVALVASTKGAIAIVPADATLSGVKKIEIK
jgi:ABC-type phosphate transport system substrate-binding protein